MNRHPHSSGTERRVLVENLPRPGRIEPLPEEEAHHLSKVLRAREGDSLETLDGKGGAAKAKLVRTAGGKLGAEYTSSIEPRGRDRTVPIELGMAILKGEAMEWVVEKCVELGVTRFVPLVTERTVVRIERKGGEAFRERWQRIADQSLKQCGRLHRMEVADPVELVFRGPDSPLPVSSPESPLLLLDEALAGEEAELLVEGLERLFGSAPDSRVRIWVGPEGGWTEEERDSIRRKLGAAAVSMGPLILRAETAAIAAAALTSQRWWRRSPAP